MRQVQNLVVMIMTTIILIGLTFWIFNNGNGIGAGLDEGGQNLKQEIIAATSGQ